MVLTPILTSTSVYTSTAKTPSLMGSLWKACSFKTAGEPRQLRGARSYQSIFLLFMWWDRTRFYFNYRQRSICRLTSTHEHRSKIPIRCGILSSIGCHCIKHNSGECVRLKNNIVKCWDSRKHHPELWHPRLPIWFGRKEWRGHLHRDLQQPGEFHHHRSRRYRYTSRESNKSYPAALIVCVRRSFQLYNFWMRESDRYDSIVRALDLEKDKQVEARAHFTTIPSRVSTIACTQLNRPWSFQQVIKV